MDKKEKVLEIINEIQLSKDAKPFSELKDSDRLRDDLALTSFDLAELTVKLDDEYNIDIFEDGIVNTVGEVYKKLGA